MRLADERRITPFVPVFVFRPAVQGTSEPSRRYGQRVRLLRCSCSQTHAREVRHATQEDLDGLEGLLADLRKLRQLRERKRGYFSRGSYAFLHFHEDRGDFYVDVKLHGAFQRMKISSHDEQTEFLAHVRRAVQSS